MLAVVGGFGKGLLSFVELTLQILVCKSALLEIFGSGKDVL